MHVSARGQIEGVLQSRMVAQSASTVVLQDLTPGADRIGRLAPVPIAHAERRVSQAVGMLGLVLAPQQIAGNGGPSKFAMDVCEVGKAGRHRCSG